MKKRVLATVLAFVLFCQPAVAYGEYQEDIFSDEVSTDEIFDTQEDNSTIINEQSDNVSIDDAFGTEQNKDAFSDGPEGIISDDYEKESIDGDAVLSANSDDLKYGDYTYKVSGECATITRYTGSDSSVIIPDQIDGYKVTEIGYTAFSSPNITMIKIPKTLKSCSYYSTGTGYYYSSFENCKNLKKIIVEDGAERIPRGLAYCLRNLEEVVIPESVKTIGTYAFSRCSNLKQVILPNELETIEDHAFAYSGLTGITFPDKLKTIGAGAFVDCPSLEDVTFSDSIIEIGGAAFSDCPKIKEIILPKNLQEIGVFAFTSPNITEIEIPKTLERCSYAIASYGYSAFSDCKNLKTIKIEDGMKTIPSGLAYRIQSLEIVKIPKSVTKIEKDAFYDCNKMTIYGYSKSYAETYAKDNNIPFVLLDINDYVSLKVLNKNTKIENQYEYEIQTEIENASNITASNINVEINLHRKMSLVKGSKLVEIPTLDPGKKKTLKWTVSADTTNMNSSEVLEYNVKVKAENSEEFIGYDSIFVEIESNKNKRLDFDKEIWDFQNYIERKPLELSNTDKNALINFYNVNEGSKRKILNRLQENQEGVCFGLSSIVALTKAGRLNINEIEPQSENLRSIKGELGFEDKNGVKTVHPKSIQARSKVLAYHLLYDAAIEFSYYNGGPTTYGVIDNLRTMDEHARKAEKNSPFLIDLQNKDTNSAHEVVGYGYENNEAGWDAPDGRRYQHRVLVYDCNADYYVGSVKGVYSYENGKWNQAAFDNHCLYYNIDMGTWCFGDNTEATSYLNFIFDLNAIPDFATGIHKSYCAWMKVNNTENINIESNKRKRILNGLMADNEIKSYYYPTGNSSANNGLNVLLKNNNIEYTVSNANQNDLDMEFAYDDVYYKVESNHCDSVSVAPTGDVSIEGNDGDFLIDVSVNKNLINIPWDNISIDGDASGTIAVKNDNKDIFIKGESLNNINVIGSNDTGSVQLKFSTNENEVLLSSSDDVLIIKEDRNHDGEFDDTVITSNNTFNKPTKPIIDKISCANNAITCSWIKQQDVDGYQVYRKINSGKWQSVKTTTSSSYKDTKVKVGYTYSYTVKAYKKVNGKKVYSDFDTKGKTGKLNTSITVTSPKVGSSLVKWKKTTGASGYYIYRSTSKKGKYSKIKTITKGNTIKFTDSKLVQGKTYYYKVTPYGVIAKKKIAGNSSAVKSIKIKSTKIALSKTKVTLEQGENITLKVTPTNLASGIKWTSSNASIAKVTSKGVVSAKKEGSAIITAKAKNGTKAMCKVTVIKNTPGVTRIYTAQDLMDVQKDMDGNYILMNDISLKGIEWKSIGKNGQRYSGNFDGNNKEIMDFNGSYGLFDNVSGQIKNLTVSGNINKEGNDLNTPRSIGTIANSVYGGKIKNCVSNVDISFSGKIVEYGTNAISGLTTIGGIVGFLGEKSKITDCVNNGNIVIDDFMLMVGGVCAAVVNDCTIQNCRNTGDITLNQKNQVNTSLYIGGIVGQGSPYPVENESIKVSKCSNSGNIKCAFLGRGSVGGVLGQLVDSSVEKCTNTGNVKTTISGLYPVLFTGGIAGYTKSTKITESINEGSIFASEMADATPIEEYDEKICAGGITGYALQNTPYNCKNTGKVEAKALDKRKAFEGDIYGWCF